MRAPPHTIFPSKPQINASGKIAPIVSAIHKNGDLEFECGGTQYYCPKGSIYPSLYSAGYYTIGGSEDNMTRTDQAICPLGSYCQYGMIFACAAGLYGNVTGQTDPRCSGLCPAGYYCPVGTSEPIACENQYFSVGGASKCSACPGSVTTTTPCRDSLTCCFRAP